MIDATGVIVLELDPPKFTLMRLPVDDVTVPTKVNVKFASTSKPPSNITRLNLSTVFTRY